MDMFWTGAGLGFLVGVLVASMYLYNVFRTHKNTPRVPVPPKRGGSGSGVMSLALMVLVVTALMAIAAPAAAQTPVPLVIPTNEIFTETNNWLVTFAPIASIGIGISIALAVLGYLGNMIKSAFKA